MPHCPPGPSLAVCHAGMCVCMTCPARSSIHSRARSTCPPLKLALARPTKPQPANCATIQNLCSGHWLKHRPGTWAVLALCLPASGMEVTPGARSVGLCPLVGLCPPSPHQQSLPHPLPQIMPLAPRRPLPAPCPCRRRPCQPPPPWPLPPPAPCAPSTCRRKSSTSRVGQGSAGGGKDPTPQA